MPSTLSALTLDLDDTLWPIWPTIERAERVLHDWLREHAPATAGRYDTDALRRLRDQVEVERPDWLHDLSAIRLESLRRALLAAGDDPQLADAAFELFFAERQKVEFYADALPALERLATRFPLFALSNGNADLARVGLAPLFRGALSAREFGVGKPDARIFHAACGRLGQVPGAVLHIGDDLRLDVRGALDAGLQAAWIHRGAEHPADLPAAVQSLPDLQALSDRLGC